MAVDTFIAFVGVYDTAGDAEADYQLVKDLHTKAGLIDSYDAAVIERRLTMSARDYIGHLSTISAYLELPAPDQEQVYSRIMLVLPETIQIAADITAHLARRRPR